MAESITALVRLQATPALSPAVGALCEGLELAVLPPRAIVRVQLPRRAAADAAAVRVHGVAFPTEPGRCAGEDPAVLWLAPDGWLLVSETREGAELARDARAALGTRTAAAVDVSDSLVTLALAGPAMREVLARSTGVDLAEATLAPGRCTRTRLAQLAVILRPRAADRVELIVDRGPARWLCDWLADAGRLL